MNYGEYLQFLKDNPEKAKEMDNNKTGLIYGLFYPIALELIKIPLYAPTIPRKIQRLLEDNDINLSLEESIKLTKDLYKNSWPKSREDILEYLSSNYTLKNTSNFLKLGLDEAIFNHFTLNKGITLYSYPVDRIDDPGFEDLPPKEIPLPNLYVDNNVEFIKLFSKKLEEELDLPKNHVLNACLLNYKNGGTSSFAYLTDFDETREGALARGLYSISYSLFRKDRLFLDKLFSYEDKLKQVS
tara:strand:+ start:27528 stop:28253 length:726 start_codon:yes stop_codon:yes gene_type:complete